MRKGPVFTIHSLAGLVSGIFILMMSLSGALLVFHTELDAFQKPMVGHYGRNDKIIPVDSSYAIIKQHYPKAEISHCVLPDSASVPFSYFLYDSSYNTGRSVMEVFIDPVTGAISGYRGGSDDIRHNFMSWLAAFHSSFHMGKTGEWLLGFFAIIFLISIITGLALYRKNILPVILFRKGVWRKKNIHQLIGVYALLFNLLIGTTGYWMQRYVFKAAFYANDSYTRVLKPSQGLFFSVDTAYLTLRKRFPDFSGSVIYFAASKKGKTAIYGSRNTNSFIHSKKFADVVLLDSIGNIAKTAFVQDIESADRYDIINAQLHYGQYGGVPVKIIYFLLGLTGGILSITGFLLWTKRRKNSYNMK